MTFRGNTLLPYFPVNSSLEINLLVYFPSSILSNAQVDLNPHQIEAALFAFKSPLSKGDILADEVGLGKTIESDIIKKIITTSQKVTNFSYISEVNLEKLNEMEVQAISVIASHKEKEWNTKTVTWSSGLNWSLKKIIRNNKNTVISKVEIWTIIH